MNYFNSFLSRAKTRSSNQRILIHYYGYGIPPIDSNNIRFIKGGVEDYQFLQDCLDKGANYVITHEKIYYVGKRSAWS